MSLLGSSARVVAAVPLALSILAHTPLAAQPTKLPTGTTMGAVPTSNSATLDGVVRDEAGAPLLGAVVTIDAIGRTALSDKLGHFNLAALPSDTIAVAVRRIGFQSAFFTVAIPAQTTVSIGVKLVPNKTELGAVVIEGERRELSLLKSGFYERQLQGLGRYLGPERLVGRENSRFTGLLREVPQIQIECQPGRGACYPIFLTSGGAAPSCVPDLYIDGKIQLGDNFDNMVDLGEVKGVEVYKRKQDVPAGFERPRTCAAILVWTSHYR